MKKSIIGLTGVMLSTGLLFTQCASHKKTAESNVSKPAAEKPAQSGSVGITLNPVRDISPDDLQGKWEFDYFTNVSTNRRILFPMQLPYLTFDVKRQKFSGMAGCNNVSGDYTMNGDQFYFKQPMVMTRMSCDAMGEKTFVNYMIAIDKVSVIENTLQFYSYEKAVMVFKRSEKK